MVVIQNWHITVRQPTESMYCTKQYSNQWNFAVSHVSSVIACSHCWHRHVLSCLCRRNTIGDSFVLSRPSFQFATVENYWKLGNWKLGRDETNSSKLGRDKTKMSCVVCSYFHTVIADSLVLCVSAVWTSCNIALRVTQWQIFIAIPAHRLETTTSCCATFINDSPTCNCCSLHLVGCLYMWLNWLDPLIWLELPHTGWPKKLPQFFVRFNFTKY